MLFLCYITRYVLLFMLCYNMLCYTCYITCNVVLRYITLSYVMLHNMLS